MRDFCLWLAESQKVVGKRGGGGAGIADDRRSWTNRAVSAVGNFVVREANVPLADLSGVERDRAGGFGGVLRFYAGHAAN